MDPETSGRYSTQLKDMLEYMEELILYGGLNEDQKLIAQVASEYLYVLYQSISHND